MGQRMWCVRARKYGSVFIYGFVWQMRGHVRSRLGVYILYDIWGDLGSTVRTRTYKIRFWKLLWK